MRDGVNCDIIVAFDGIDVKCTWLASPPTPWRHFLVLLSNHEMSLLVSHFMFKILMLRIDTGGWSVNYCARFNEATTRCSLAN